MGIEFTDSAAKHRIGQRCAAHVVRNALAVLRQGDDVLMHLGADQNGVLPEVAGVDLGRDLLVIHAMPMRDKFLPYLENR